MGQRASRHGGDTSVTADQDDAFVCRAPHGTLIVHDNAQAVEVHLRGEFDLSSTEASTQVIERVAQSIADRPRPVIVDMSGVSFFDAAGVRVLQRLDRIADLASATMLVANPPRNVCRLLELVGLDDLLKRT